jgi:NADH dehydrogenase FAD-containing subunit
LTRILILGGGFAGVQVLKKLQAEFQNDTNIEITLVSKDNFFLFTPMLPEVASGTIEPIHIATPHHLELSAVEELSFMKQVQYRLSYKIIIIHSVNDNNKIVQTSRLQQQQQGSTVCYHEL